MVDAILSNHGDEPVSPLAGTTKKTDSVQQRMGDQNNSEIGQFTRASQLLRKKDLKSDEASGLTELTSNMASVNLVSQLGSKIDAVNSMYTVLIGLVNSGSALAIAM
ncbi:MAG: hypothetical protein OXD43_06770 [Bacteroidetes bacterium]|nr:hypothetical protein [Bacteroidota bacterium]